MTLGTTARTLPGGYTDAAERAAVGRAARVSATSADGIATVLTIFPVTLDRGARKRFAHDLESLRGLPALDGFVPVADGGITPDGFPFVARAADDAAAPPGDPLDVAERILSGLANLHAHAVVHGAVSPGTVVARSIADPVPSAVIERMGAIDPPYAAPEVLEGHPPRPASDVWSAAATIVHLLTGRPPFDAGPGGKTDPAAMLLRVLAEPPDLVRFGVSPATAAVLTRALDRDPRPRPSADELRSLLSGSDHIETLPPSATVSALAGTAVGSGYLLHDRLGRGAMGEVYRGSVRATGDAVAIKVLRSELAEDQTLVTRFLQERMTLTGISHPNLVRVRDLVAEGSTLAIVMDLVDGPDLRGYLRTASPLAPSEACQLLSQLTAALGAVHAAGVVHRDLKPENVLLELPGPSVRLTDFGVARSSTGPGVTKLDQLVGTPEYLAPEVARGEPAGPAADVYAVGVLAYELLVGCRPFVADHPAALIRAHLSLQPPRPPGIDDSLWDLVASCLAKRPEDRPSPQQLTSDFAEQAAALAGRPPLPQLDRPPVAPESRDDGDELETAHGTAPPLPRPAAPASEGGRWGWRRLAVLGGVVAVVAAAVGIWLGTRGDGGDDPGPTSQRVAIPAQITSHEVVDQEDLRLHFSDLSGTEGFERYIVIRDPDDGNAVLNDQPLAGSTFVDVPYLGAEHCYVIQAIVRIDPDQTPPSYPAFAPYCVS